MFLHRDTQLFDFHSLSYFKTLEIDFKQSASPSKCTDSLFIQFKSVRWLDHNNLWLFFLLFLGLRSFFFNDDCLFACLGWRLQDERVHALAHELVLAVKAENFTIDEPVEGTLSSLNSGFNTIGILLALSFLGEQVVHGVDVLV